MNKDNYKIEVNPETGAYQIRHVYGSRQSYTVGYNKQKVIQLVNKLNQPITETVEPNILQTEPNKISICWGNHNRSEKCDYEEIDLTINKLQLITADYQINITEENNKIIQSFLDSKGNIVAKTEMTLQEYEAFIEKINTTVKYSVGFTTLPTSLPQVDMSNRQK